MVKRLWNKGPFAFRSFNLTYQGNCSIKSFDHLEAQSINIQTLTFYHQDLGLIGYNLNLHYWNDFSQKVKLLTYFDLDKLDKSEII